MSIKYLNIFQLSQGSTRERLSPPFRMGPERPGVLDASKASSGSGHRKRKLAMGRGRESHQSPRAPGVATRAGACTSWPTCSSSHL